MSINKIDGPGGVKPGAPKRAGSSGATGGTSFASLLQGPEKAASQVTQAPPVAALDAMLAVQAVDEQGGGRQNRQRAFRRGSNLLEKLEEIRTGLLTGSIPKDRLQALAQALRSERLAVEDPVWRRFWRRSSCAARSNWPSLASDSSGLYTIFS